MSLFEKLDGNDVGRDPRQVGRDELIAAGHEPISVMKAIRARCLDGCCDQPTEVRKCTSTTCPSRPFRMGSSPWRAAPSAAQREARRLSGVRLAVCARDPSNLLGPDDEVSAAGTFAHVATTSAQGS